MLIQKRQLTKTINVSAYKIILRRMYIYPHRQELLLRSNNIHIRYYFRHLSECLFTDRKKDLVKLQLGEYVSLGKVEAELKTCPVVENICVYGDANKAYTVALVVPNQHYLEEIASNLGITGKTLEELCSDSEIEKAVLQELVEQAKKCMLYILDFCVIVNKVYCYSIVSVCL